MSVLDVDQADPVVAGEHKPLAGWRPGSRVGITSDQVEPGAVHANDIELVSDPVLLE